MTASEKGVIDDFHIAARDLEVCLGPEIRKHIDDDHAILVRDSSAKNVA